MSAFRGVLGILDTIVLILCIILLYTGSKKIALNIRIWSYFVVFLWLFIIISNDRQTKSKVLVGLVLLCLTIASIIVLYFLYSNKKFIQSKIIIIVTWIAIWLFGIGVIGYDFQVIDPIRRVYNLNPIILKKVTNGPRKLKVPSSALEIKIEQTEITVHYKDPDYPSTWKKPDEYEDHLLHYSKWIWTGARSSTFNDVLADIQKMYQPFSGKTIQNVRANPYEKNEQISDFTQQITQNLREISLEMNSVLNENIVEDWNAEEHDEIVVNAEIYHYGGLETYERKYTQITTKLSENICKTIENHIQSFWGQQKVIELMYFDPEIGMIQTFEPELSREDTFDRLKNYAINNQNLFEISVQVEPK